MKQPKLNPLAEFLREILGSLSIQEVTQNQVLTQKAQMLFTLLARRAE